MDNNAVLFFVISMFVITTVIAVILAIRARRSGKPGRKVLLADLLAPYGAVRRKGIQQIFDGVYKDRNIRFLYFPGAKNSPPYLKAYFPIAFKNKLIIKKESSFESFSKKIGLTREIQTGDMEFDEKYFIDTGSEEFARAYLGEGARRQQIDAILGDERVKAHSIELKKGEICLHIPLVRQKLGKLDKDSLLNCIDNLLELSMNMPSTSEDFEHKLNPGAKNKPVFAIFVIVGLIDLLGILALIAGSLNYRLVDRGLYLDSFMYSVPVLIVFWFFILPYIKGRSDSHIIASVLLVMSLTGFIIAGMGFLVFSNGYMDQSPVQYKSSEVLEKYSQTGENSTSYYIRVSGWQEDPKDLSLPVPHGDYEGYSKGDRVIIQTKSGYWKYEWIVSFARRQD